MYFDPLQDVYGHEDDYQDPEPWNMLGGTRDERYNQPDPIVTFSVFVDYQLLAGDSVEIVVFRPGTNVPPQRVPMRRTQFGEGLLWSAAVPFRPVPMAPVEYGHSVFAQGQRPAHRVFGRSHSRMLGEDAPLEPLAPLAPVFEVQYIIVTETGDILRERADISAAPHVEQGRLKKFYFHASNLNPRPSNSSKIFPCFVNDEIHQLQANLLQPSDFALRFDALKRGNFSVDRSLLDMVLEHLISTWKGAVPAPVTVLAFAFMTGAYIHRDRDFDVGAMYKRNEKAKDPERPLSLIVCRWIVQQWSHEVQAACREQQAGQDGAGVRRREVFPRFSQYISSGLVGIMENLYHGQKSFEWFRLLSFVPIDSGPKPLNASECGRQAGVLVGQFENEQIRQVGDIVNLYNRLERKHFADEKVKEEVCRRAQAEVLETLEALFRYAPSVDAMARLLQNIEHELGQATSELAVGMFQRRLRTLYFGQEDKAAFVKNLLYTMPSVASEETAAAVLNSAHHPSSDFPAVEMLDMVHRVMEVAGKTTGSPSFANTASNWLRRHFVRTVLKPKDSEKEIYHTNVRDAQDLALRGWNLVLALPFFNTKEHKDKLLFDLAQIPIFQSKPLVVLSCLLELEHTILGFTSPELKDEIQQIAMRSIRRVEKNKEDKLLSLLFEVPTPFRFTVVRNYIIRCDAAQPLKQILANAQIWSRLLSPSWSKAAGLSRSPLGEIVAQGTQMLSDTAVQLRNKTLPLLTLSVLKTHSQAYLSLIKDVVGRKYDETRDATLEAIATLTKFDLKLEQLGSYIRMFCAGNTVPIEVAKLENLVEGVRKDYSNDNIVLKSAFGRINKVEAWDHLEWLYAQRSSPTFLHIWTDARLDAGAGDTSKILTQEEVVKVVIPKARSVWEELATGISRGSVPMGSVRWAVSQPWAQVVQELGLLEKTGGANAGDEMWAEAARNLQAMRLLDRLQGLAPAVLSLAQALEDLWTTDRLLQDDFKVECEAIVTNLASMSVTTLGRAQELAAPYRGTFEVLDEATQIYLITAATLTDPIVWLSREAKKLDEFNGLIAITRPKTDDLRLLEGLAALQQTRTLLADMLYTRPPYSHTKQLMEAFASATIDGTAQRALEATQLSFKPLLDLLTRNTRSPGVQACYDLKMLCDTGTFSVVCSSVVSDQIICFVPDGKPEEWHREDLADLRQQLLMTEVPPDIEGRAELPNLLENFVAKCQILESYSHCVEELFSLGYFQLEVGQTVMTLAPGTSMDATRQLLVEREEILRDWEAEVAAARDKYYFLNYFVVRELRYLAKLIPSAAMHDDEAWKVTWPLLRIVSPQADEFHTRQQLDVMQDLTLGELGALLHELFEKTALVERPLSGLTGQVSSVGVHLIRPVSDHERDSDIDVVPVYICTVEEEPLVVEAVLSVFMSSSRVPEAEEVLFCSGSTTAEEVELLFRRFFSARTHGRQERIYCLAGAQLLPYMVQSRAIQTFRRLEEKLSFKDASCLAIVNGGMQQTVLANALLSRKANTVNLPHNPNDTFLRQAVEVIGNTYHGRKFETVASEMNGCGKSFHIMQTISMLQAESPDNMPMPHRIDVRETTDTSSLVAALLADPTDPALPTVVQINLGHIFPGHIDMLLFQLLITGVLRDPWSAMAYHRRTMDMFIIEIPNTPMDSPNSQENRTYKTLPLVMLLPRTFLEMKPEKLSLQCPHIDVTERGPVVTMVPNPDLPIVGKILEALDGGLLDPEQKATYAGNWTLKSAADVPPQRMYELLCKYCCTEETAPTFLLFSGFVRLFSELISQMEQFPIVASLALQAQFATCFRGLKSSFVRLLMETCCAFVVNHVPKQHGDPELHPLHPPKIHPFELGAPTLARALSRTMTSRSSGCAAAPLAPPPLQREKSVVEKMADEGPRPAVDAAYFVETSGAGRLAATSYVHRLAKLPGWEKLEHPIAYFVRSAKDKITGVNIISVNNRFLERFIPKSRQRNLELQGIKLSRNWRTVTHKEAVECILNIEGGEMMSQMKEKLGAPTTYHVTLDNLIKIMNIQQKLKYGLPVLLMGETGCGKTSLVNYISQVMDVPLMTLDIHGGISDADIEEFMDTAVATVSEQEQNKFVMVFFDEINAANCMGQFKTLIVDRMHRGRPIPNKLRIISCCNPYRFRQNTEIESVALTYQHQQGDQASGLADPTRQLVYRVHPLPESLIDIVNDFGALSEESEDIYILSILRTELREVEEASAADAKAPKTSSDYALFIETVKNLICVSQSFVRECHDMERSVVSMRDVARAVKVCKWFLTYYARLRGVASPVVEGGDSGGPVTISVGEEFQEHLRSALVLTLGYCYHARLSREDRAGYRRRICTKFQEFCEAMPRISWLNLNSPDDLERKLVDVQYEFVAQMELGEGIALNEALRENLFMLLVSIMNQVPILLVGKPGCSKSLAMDILKSNLNGEVSTREFFRSMPAVEVFAYQCSPLSTPDAILNAFNAARNSNIGDPNTIVCVLLDEVGLAEESPHLPLKVLHRELEHLEGIACVGISNWLLDAAKMNRCVMLYRPLPTVDDLCKTAEGMATNCANLQGYLSALAQAFFSVYYNQKQDNFWGMREFYSTIRALSTEFRRRAANGEQATLEPELLMKTVLRNFGGRPASETDWCVNNFFHQVLMSSDSVHRLEQESLIAQNLEEPEARHLMLLTKNSVALRLLFETGLLNHQGAEIMFGGTFPGDQSDVIVATNLQRVKTFMQRPISLVMVHCDALYESLYDLLNQHYMEFAGQRYVRIAHGARAKQCPIHERFRIVVIVEEYDAYNKLAPPLLNRFEKQVFNRSDLMTLEDSILLEKVNDFWDSFLSGLLPNFAPKVEEGRELDPAVAAAAAKSLRAAAMQTAVAGYHSQLISSLVFMLRRRKPDVSAEKLFVEARELLIRAFTPEAVCIHASRPDAVECLNGFDLVDAYFKQQSHMDLPSFVSYLLEDQSCWTDTFGVQVMAITYSPLRGEVASCLSKPYPKAGLQEVMLHELSASQDMENIITRFYQGRTSGEQQFLIIRADPAACSLRMIEHTRFMCERARADFVQRCTGEDTGEAGTRVVMLVVHLERGQKGFSFDFDSAWFFAFLDSVEAPEEGGGLPTLAEMLNTPLLEVLKGCDFAFLLRRCFRESLARLVYPHSTTTQAELQQQIIRIQKNLRDEKDSAFVQLVQSWALKTLQKTPKPSGSNEISVGDDPDWFADVAAAGDGLALAGTLRTALHNRIVAVISALFAVVLAHFDRNNSMALLSDDSKRSLWLTLAEPSLSSPMSVQLSTDAMQAVSAALRGERVVMQEVFSDAKTKTNPFVGRFPYSWFVSKTIDNAKDAVQALPWSEQLAALEAHYKLTQLETVRLNPSLEIEVFDDYLVDFTAMHVECASVTDRAKQTEVVRAVCRRCLDGDVTNILHLHLCFWRFEKQFMFCVNLVKAVPTAVPEVLRLIQGGDLSELNLRCLLTAHRSLIAEFEAYSGTSASDREFYFSWHWRHRSVNGIEEDFLAEDRTSDQSTEAWTELKGDTRPRLETLALFVQLVAYPCRLRPSAVGDLVKELSQGQSYFYSSTSLAAILKAVANAWSENRMQELRSFVEHWIMDVCLKDAAATEHQEVHLTKLLCSVAAGVPVKMVQTTIGVTCVPPEELAGVQTGAEDESPDADMPLAILSTSQIIPRSSGLSLALLRKLCFRTSGGVLMTAKMTLRELLVSTREQRGHNDSKFANNFATISEEMHDFLHGQNPELWPEITVEQVTPQAVPHEALDKIGLARVMFRTYATKICDKHFNQEDHDAVQKKVLPLLMDFDRFAVSRSMRLFVMKCIQRARGVSFLRGELDRSPMKDSAWVEKWRSIGDVPFEKFVGAAKVPLWNPFLAEDMPSEFQSAYSAVLQVLTAQSAAKLTTIFSGSGQWSETRRRENVAALMFALVREPGLLAVLETREQILPPWRTVLHEWLRNSSALPVSARERMLLRVFAGDDEAVVKLEEEHPGFVKLFSLRGGRRMDSVFFWRVLGHQAAALISAPDASLLSLLRTLMLEPERISFDMHLPSMDEDTRKMLQRALEDAGEHIYKYAAHWYKCTDCGYPFFIGECGRPMQVAPCPACKNPVGGQAHNPTDSTQLDTTTDLSPFGYTLRAAEHDEAVLSFRGVAQSEARAMRLLVHCAMCLGLVAHLSDGTASTSTSASSSTPSPDAGSRIYQHLANPTTATSLHQRPEMTFLADHALRDWELLSDSLGNCEDLAMGFHSLIGSLRTAVDMPNFAAASEGRGVSWGRDETAQNFKKTWTGSWAVPVTQEHRNHWEWTLQEKHLHAFCQTFGSTDKRTTRVADLTLRWSGSAEKDGVLMEQIREAVDVDVFPTAQRHDEMPKVWSFREQVALGDVVKFRKLFSAERFPVLDVLLQTRPYYLDILPALQTLGSVFQWQSLVRARYSRRLTKEEASRLTVREAMNDLPTNADRAEWEHALLRVQTAWKEVIPVVEEFRCLPFPKHFRRIEKLTDTHPLSFFIASDNDEGVPLLAITEWLVARQNELVRVANDARRYTPVEVSSSTLKPHDLINFSKDAMMRFLLERCVAHGHGGALQLDIPLLEAFLQTTFLKPSIQIEREPFMWLGDAGAKVEVKTALAQRPLEHEVRQRLRAEIKTASVASVCLEKVTMASAFIVKAGAALSSEQAGSTLLAEYLQNVLMESPTRCMPSSTARSEVRLCHIDDFATTLRRVMNPDPMDNVAAVYKQPLGLLEPLVQDEVQKLRDCGPLVARAMAKFAEEQLTSEEIGPEVTLVDFLAYFISSNCSEDPLSSASGDAVARFSRELQMRHWEKTFRLVQLAVEGHAD